MVLFVECSLREGGWWGFTAGVVVARVAVGERAAAAKAAVEQYSRERLTKQVSLSGALVQEGLLRESSSMKLSDRANW